MVIWEIKNFDMGDKRCWHEISKILTLEIKVVNISEQQLRLPSGISGPPTAADNFSTNVFLASNKYHQLWKEILNDSPAEILLLKNHIWTSFNAGALHIVLTAWPFIILQFSNCAADVVTQIVFIICGCHKWSNMWRLISFQSLKIIN